MGERHPLHFEVLTIRESVFHACGSRFGAKSTVEQRRQALLFTWDCNWAAIELEVRVER